MAENNLYGTFLILSNFNDKKEKDIKRNQKNECKIRVYAYIFSRHHLISFFDPAIDSLRMRRALCNISTG